MAIENFDSKSFQMLSEIVLMKCLQKNCPARGCLKWLASGQSGLMIQSTLGS